MKVTYKSLSVYTEKENYEVLAAMLSTFNFDSFYEADEALIGYFTDQVEEALLLHYLKDLQGNHEFTYQIDVVEDKNWNEEWESKFDPIYIDKFVCVRADFHEAPREVKYDIIINPKMSFGTGHHETTYMMMDMMRDLDLVDKKLLDLGCGTSILAILAEKMGARDILAIDFDENCVINSKENLTSNNCNDVSIDLGTIDDVATDDYQVILANINRVVLMECGERIKSKMRPGGLLLLSGVLQEDGDMVVSEYKRIGFLLVEKRQRGEWLCMLWKCPSA